MVNKYYGDIINLTELVEYINKRIDRNKVKVNIVDLINTFIK